MPHPQGTPQPPQIAIVMSNTLAALGLSQIIGRMMPHARLVTYVAPGDLPKEKAESFFHFFISVWNTICILEKILCKLLYPFLLKA